MEQGSVRRRQVDGWRRAHRQARQRSCFSRVLRALVTVVATIAVGPGSTVWAADQPRRVALTWDAPAGCPSSAAVVGDVERTLAESGHARAPVAATARVVASSGEPWQVSLTLDVRGTRTERRFQAESCDAIAAAAVLIIALAADDSSEEKSDSKADSKSDSKSDSRSDTSPSPAPRATIPRTWSRSQFSVMLTEVVDWDTMPDPLVFGLEAGAGWSWTVERWRLGALAGASFFPSQQYQLLGWPDGMRGDFWLLNVSGRGCLSAAISRFEVGPCLGAELATMHASDGGSESSGLTVADSTQFWLSLLGSAVASWNVARTLVVVLRADILVPGTRRSFLAGNDFELYHLPEIAFRGALGIEYRFK